MIRKRTIESYKRFFKPIYESEFPGPVDDILVLLKGFNSRLGFHFIETLPKCPLDIASTNALVLMHAWKETIAETENIILIHDRSSNMAREKDFWDRLVSPKTPPKLVGYDRRKISFPLRIKRTEFKNSKKSIGLQIADILAGAITRYFKWINGGKNVNDDYGKELALNISKSFDGSLLWPSPHFTPEELGTKGTDAENPIDYISNIRKNL